MSWLRVSPMMPRWRPLRGFATSRSSTRTSSGRLATPRLLRGSNASSSSSSPSSSSTSPSPYRRVVDVERSSDEPDEAELARVADANASALVAAMSNLVTFDGRTVTRSPYIHRNRAFQACREGKSVVGTMIAEFRQISSVQIMRNSGMDFVIIDNEHGMFGRESVADLCRSARVLGLTPMVRIPNHSYDYVAQALDAGAQGLVFPRIDSVDQIHELVHMARYPPTGRRGHAMYRSYSDWKGGPVVDAMVTHNYETMLCFQIETRESIEQLDEMLSVPGVDAVLVGPNDLSIALGVPDDWDSPAMQSAMEEIVETCNRRGVIPGIHISDTKQTIEYARKGFRLLSANSESGFMQTAAATHVNVVKAFLKEQAVDQSIPGEGPIGSY